MFRMPKLVLLAFSLIVLAAPIPAFADDSTAPSSASHDNSAQTPSAKFIQSLGDRAIKIIANKQMPVAQRNASFSQILSDSFDLKTIARFVIGRTWNTATPAQQTEYLSLFKALVIHNYGERMTLYTGENFKVTSSRSESDLDTTVISEITHPDGSQPTQIDWRVRQKDGKMGVIDVIVEGVSLSVTQRQEYAAVIQRNGGQIDGLLDTMRGQLQEPTSMPKGNQTPDNG